MSLLRLARVHAALLWVTPAFFLLTGLPPAAAAQVPPSREVEALQGTLLVSAASSLTEIFSTFAQQFEARHPEVRVRLNFGGSAVLATQIERGAPVSVFAAAGQLPIASLLRKGRIAAGAVRVFAHGELVLVSKQAGLTLSTIARSDRPLAVGNPRLAPVGAYAERSLEAFGLTADFQGRLVLGENVRQVLRYVETGAVAGGLVYRTDAVSSPGLQVTQTIPTEISGRIEYPIVATANARDVRLADAFVEFVCGPLARDEFLRRGFLPTCPAGAP